MESNQATLVLRGKNSGEKANTLRCAQASPSLFPLRYLWFISSDLKDHPSPDASTNSAISPGQEHTLGVQGYQGSQDLRDQNSKNKGTGLTFCASVILRNLLISKAKTVTLKGAGKRLKLKPEIFPS